MERFLKACPNRRISGLLADREFIGTAWFTYLQRLDIDPCIRLTATTVVGTGKMPVWACFKQMQPGAVRFWHHARKVYGVSLLVAATCNPAGEVLYLAYRGQAGKNLARDARRWQAENLHAALKTRGFHLEDTGLTQAERVSTLLTAVSITFIWACLTGEIQATEHTVRRKKHGHLQVSVFRLGLDHLQDLLAHPSRSSWSTLEALIACFE
ncbi:hypothetical protein GCM10008957_23760 [Deinococcus ruber]|uniref:Transposase IS4-like domain-containing protein n=2 Tax=Deinococcus ruber TaxID=1848197 RepID=A0A918F843_9DEIO|nr:hypothetical protein GCM10008957_23760 [Deinococcus ruber]